MSRMASNIDLFTDDYLKQASTVVYGNAWQNEGGITPFADAMATLSNVLAELRTAEAEGISDNMPAGLQNTINTRLTNLLTHLNQIQHGASAHIAPFTDEVDRLHMDIWAGGFRFRGKKPLGIESKLHQANQIARELERAREAAAAAEATLQKIKEESAAAEQSAASVNKRKAELDSQAPAIDEARAAVESANDNLSAQVQQMNQFVERASHQASTAEAHAQTAATAEKRVQAFVERTEAAEIRLEDAITSARQGLEENSAGTKKFLDDSQANLGSLIDRLRVTEKDLQDKLSKATGVTLFHSFEARQKAISGKLWLGAAAVILVAALGAAFVLIWNTTAFNVAFFTRIGIVLPALFAIGFCLRQYGRERRLIEEYAFKSAISLSLQPYRELVLAAVHDLPPEKHDMYADFLVRSINSIFESPTERVFGDRQTRGPSDSKIISQFIHEIKEVSEIVRAK